MPYELPVGKCIVVIVSKTTLIEPDPRVEVVSMREVLESGSIELPDNADLIITGPGLGLTMTKLEKEKSRLGARLQIKVSDQEVANTLKTVLNPALDTPAEATTSARTNPPPANQKPIVSSPARSHACTKEAKTTLPEPVAPAKPAASLLVVGAQPGLFLNHIFPIRLDHWTKAETLASETLPETCRLVLVDASRGRRLVKQVEYLAGYHNKPWKAFADTKNMLDFLERYTSPERFTDRRPKSQGKPEKRTTVRATKPTNASSGWSSANLPPVKKKAVQLTPQEEKLKKEVARGLAKLRARELAQSNKK